MSNYREPSTEELESLKKAGQKRAESERKLLLLMFDGFSNLRIEQKEFARMRLIEEHCSLENYAHSHADLSPDYAQLPKEAKTYFHVLLALDSLVSNALVERKIWFSDDLTPEDGFKDLEDKLGSTEAWRRIWKARSLIALNEKEKSFRYPDYMRSQDEYPTIFTLEYIEYQLTTKGFDVALKFQEHNDLEKRFSEQSKLTEKAVQASASSAKTARIALWAAIAIAIGSLGNLILSIFVQCPAQ